MYDDYLEQLHEAIQQYIKEFISLGLVKKVVTIIAVAILMYFSIKIGKHLIKKFVEKQVASNAILSLDTQRAKTLGEVLKSVLKYSVYFIGITIIISTLFGGISFTFASISGIAVGLGTQSLIKDLINGFFILFENQFGVGDYITVGNYNGIVKSIGIRTTVINDFTGDVHSIPNGSITAVTNHSRNDIKFIVDVTISSEENIQKVIDIIKITCDEFQIKNKGYIGETLEFIGITALELLSVTIRVSGKAKPLMQWQMERELRMAIKLALDKNNIDMKLSENQLDN